MIILLSLICAKYS